MEVCRLYCSNAGITLTCTDGTPLFDQSPRADFVFAHKIATQIAWQGFASPAPSLMAEFNAKQLMEGFCLNRVSRQWLFTMFYSFGWTWSTRCSGNESESMPSIDATANPTIEENTAVAGIKTCFSSLVFRRCLFIRFDPISTMSRRRSTYPNQERSIW